MNTAPRPTPPAPVSGLHTNLETVLRLVLERVDPTKTTPAAVRAKLAGAGVIVTEEWAADWIDRTLVALAKARS